MKYLILFFILFSYAQAVTVPEKDSSGKVITQLSAFAAKSNHTFKGQGISCTATLSASSNCDYVIPYAHVKFNGIEIINGQVGDKVNLKIIDTATGTYSTIPNYTLNQFGYDWYLKNQEASKEILPYVSDLYNGMIIRVEYNNASSVSRTIYVNFYIHEEI
jgi:hypothetical protein